MDARLLARGSFAATFVLTAVSGSLLGFMKYLMTPKDPLAVINHPLQPWMLALHVVVAPLFMVALGMAVMEHVRYARIGRFRRRLRSGLPLTAAMAAAIASGYAIQVVTAERLLQLSRYLHLVSSALAVVMLVVHLKWRRAVENPGRNL